MFRHVLTAFVLLAAFVADAKTPGEVYEQAAKSTVVVRNIDSERRPKSMGSGVVLPDRDVVTNCHVVKGASQLTVRIGTKEYPATLLHSDWDRDVCSLSVSGISAPAVVVGSTKTLKVGAKVYAIGAPKGLELTLSDGIVSSLRQVEGGQYIQTTAPISPGSSGGGLFDENGALVGLITFYFAEGQNLNFAVPIEWVKELPKRSVKIATNSQTDTQWLNKSIELENHKDWSAMIDHGLRWTKVQPTSGTAWNNLGIAYGRSGQNVKAIDALQQALRLEPEFASAWNNLSIVYAGTGHPVKAVEALERALRLDPKDAVAWNNLGNAYSKVGKPAKAIEAYQQALRINPEHSTAWYNLGGTYDESGQSAKAIEAYEQALRIDPKLASAWFNLGIAYANADQRAKVLDVYEHLKSLDPSRAERFFKNVVMP